MEAEYDFLANHLKPHAEAAQEMFEAMEATAHEAKHAAHAYYQKETVTLEVTVSFNHDFPGLYPN